MATGIFATVAEVQRKVTPFASAVSNTEAFIDDYTTQVESMINAQTELNWSDAYSGLNVDVKGILKMAATALVAFMVIDYDTSLFPSSRQAETTMDGLVYQYKIAVAELKQQSQRAFVQNA